MHLKILTILFILLSFWTSAQTSPSSQLGISDKLFKEIQEGHIHAKSTVKNLENDKKQSLNFVIIGLHKKSCEFALQKLSLYENFQNYMGMVEKSSYDNKSQYVNLLLSHSLLPFRMTLKFKLPRIKSEGKYPFYFDNGFLKGLQGIINVSSYKKRCLFRTEANWKGKHSGFSPTFFEFFSSAAAKHSMEVLFRISSTY